MHLFPQTVFSLHLLSCIVDSKGKETPSFLTNTFMGRRICWINPENALQLEAYNFNVFYMQYIYRDKWFRIE